MKKLLSITLCILLIAGVSACGDKTEAPSSSPASQEMSQSSTSAVGDNAATTATPSGTIELLMESVKSFQPEEMRKYVTEPKGTNKLISDSVDGTGNLDQEEELGMGFVRQYTSRITYKVINEDIQGNTATVDLDMRTPDLSDAITSLITETTNYATTKALKGEPMDVEGFMMDYVKENINFDALPTVDSKVKATLVKQNDGTWLVDNDAKVNRELSDALSGNVLDRFNDLASLTK